eukprot:755500-Hanusia_phi.AAC.2
MEDNKITDEASLGLEAPKSDDSDSNRSTRSHVTISTSILKNKNDKLLLPGETTDETKDDDEENSLTLTIFPAPKSKHNEVGPEGRESIGKEQSEVSSKMRIIRISSFFGKNTRDPEPILVTSKRKGIKQDAESESKHVHFKIPRASSQGRFHLFHHKSKILARWHSIMLLPLSYEPWAYPFRLAFCNPGLGLHSTIRILPFDLACDGMFLLDTLFRLFSIVPAGTYPGQDFDIDKFDMIVINYLYHDFARQWLPVIVYYIVTFSIPDDTRWMVLWWVAAIPRLILRTLRLWKYFKAMTVNLDNDVQKLQSFKVGLVVILSSHWVGCMFYWIARLQAFAEDTWVHQMELVIPLYTHQHSAANDYIVCLYKGLNALSTLGYDGGIPNNIAEILSEIVVMALQIYLQGLILGTLLNYLVKRNPMEEAHKEHVAQVAQFLIAKQVPNELRENVTAYFEFQYKKNMQNQAQSLISLPRSLKIKVADANYSGLLEKCAMRGKPMQGCNSQFLHAFMTKLRPVYCMPGEAIVQKDEEGIVHIFDDEDKIIGVIRNDVPDMAPLVGEVAFFLGINYVTTIKARHDGDVQLLVLKKEDSMEIFNNYPEEQLVISENILRTFDLDIDGLPLSGTDEDANDKLKTETKNRIIDSLKLRSQQRFHSLCSSVSAGDADTVKMLIRQGADLNETDYDKRTVLHMACAEGNYKIVEVRSLLALLSP